MALAMAGFLFAFAFVLQWATNRWWLATSIPVSLLVTFALVGGSTERGGSFSAENLPYTFGAVFFVFLLTVCGVLTARIAKFRGSNRPALGPQFIKAVSLIFAIYGCYVAIRAINEQSLGAAVTACVALAAAIGAWLRKPWSQYLVYALSLWIIVGWLWALWVTIQNGTWAYESFDKSAFALAPFFVLAFLCASSSLVVFRSFRRRQ